jgi:fucose 4-O-acetylase-like acetyltransferase
MTIPMTRRHDLDALRAVAMLLGIALHGALSFAPIPWPVQDSRQSEAFHWFFAAIHGFRMPLFFLLSGFFTAMLWRQRGLGSVMWQRFRRVFLPCMAGLFTIVPAVMVTGIVVTVTAPTPPPPPPPLPFALAAPAADGTPSAWRSTAEVGNALIGIALALMFIPVFHHLWFLWFLCWLVVVFAAYAAIADGRQWKGPPRWLILSPLRFLWILPVTMLPQAVMGLIYPTFGPDTSTGLLPAPHILLYYAIFFFFGAMYFDCDDREGRVGQWWPLALPFGLLIVFPLGFDFTLGEFGWREHLTPPGLHRPIAIVLQVVYAWTMCFALMGLFRQLLSRESATMRYLSDSSYWLYLAHLPLIFIAQAIVRTWPLPPLVKFLLVCGAVTLCLLFTYQTLVRYTWLGTFLNGPRKRRTPAAAPIVAELVGG